MDDGLVTGSLSEVNLDEVILGRAVDRIRKGKYGEIHSMLIYKDGMLVFEEYFPGHKYKWDGPGFHGSWVNWDIHHRHNVHSVGKSITAACIGIAVDLGFIKSVKQSIFDYLPKYQQLNTAGKEQITIEHLLTMSSGLKWEEWDTTYSNQNNDLIALWVHCEDPVKCILEVPLVSEPGKSFTYSGGNMIVLGEILKNASGMDIETFSWQYLFEPLGIEKPPWEWINETGVIYAGGSQKLTPREMLKFGVMYLNQGVWNGKQIVSENWVEKSVHPYSGPGNTWFNHFLRPIPPGCYAWGHRGYSYSWWTHDFSHADRDFPAFWCGGWGGQKIIVLPEQNTVVVFTGANYTIADPTINILLKNVFPAFE
ncbi:MAG: beta-lactamase family protein [Spirochaetes bacterium]|nr:beta-lactamase family protein [Spirochaetota bacterium]